MGHIVDSAVVRIMRAERPVGAGCLVHGRLILTCAHVVRDALDLPRTAIGRPKDPVLVEFPKYPDLKDLWAHAIVWHCWADGVADDGLTDIAVLDIGEGLGDPLPAHLLKSEDERLGKVLSYGFPEDAPLGARHGQWLEAEADLEVIGPAWFPLYRTLSSRSFIRPGYSGGPVVVDEGGAHAGRVAGIVAVRNRESAPEKQAAYAIGAEVLRRVLDQARLELDEKSRPQPRAGGSPSAPSAPHLVLGEDLTGTLDELRRICADLQSQHNVPVDLIKDVDRLARSSQRAVRADGEPDLQRLADYNEDWADLAAVVDREEAADLFESSPVRKLIDQIDQLTNRIRPSKGPVEPTLHIPWHDPAHPATQAARALKAECDEVMDRLWPEGAEAPQAKRDAWHDVEEVHRTATRRDGYDTRRMDGCRKRLERRKVNLLRRTRALIGVLQGKFADRLRPGTVFRDHEHGPEMVVIPAGSFDMGSPENELGRMQNEGPQHRVTLAQAFALGRYPITFEEFDIFGRSSGRDLPSDEGWGRLRRPVVNVSFEDARNYLTWLSQNTGHHYRLPSEAEWEYACRAGTITRYAFGDEFSHRMVHASVASIDAVQNVDEIQDIDAVGLTAEVGNYPPNAFGLFDMHGNVDEWCADNYHLDFRDAPIDGSSWDVGGTVVGAPVRGGSWLSIPQDCRSAYRQGPTRENSQNWIGFRAARMLG